MTPLSRIETIWEADFPAMNRTARTATTAKTKAAAWAGTFRPRKTRDRAAPKAAP